jgi:hypothetical protein
MVKNSFRFLNFKMLEAFRIISCFNFIVTNITKSYSNATAKSYYPELITFDLNLTTLSWEAKSEVASFSKWFCF